MTQQSKVREILEFVWSLSPHNKDRMAEAEQALYEAVKSASPGTYPLDSLDNADKESYAGQYIKGYNQAVSDYSKALNALFGKKGKTE